VGGGSISLYTIPISKNNDDKVINLINNSINDAYILLFYKSLKSIYYRNIFGSLESITISNITFVLAIFMIFFIFVRNMSSVETEKLIFDEISTLLVLITYINVVKKNSEIMNLELDIVSLICLLPYYAFI
jgi:hypothetical protein